MFAHYRRDSRHWLEDGEAIATKRALTDGNGQCADRTGRSVTLSEFFQVVGDDG